VDDDGAIDERGDNDGVEAFARPALGQVLLALVVEQCPDDWREEGIAPALIAPTMGHASSAMVEKVYGKLTGAEIAKQIGEVISIRDAGRRRAQGAP